MLRSVAFFLALPQWSFFFWSSCLCGRALRLYLLLVPRKRIPLQSLTRYSIYWEIPVLNLLSRHKCNSRKFAYTYYFWGSLGYRCREGLLLSGNKRSKNALATKLQSWKLPQNAVYGLSRSPKKARLSRPPMPLFFVVFYDSNLTSHQVGSVYFIFRLLALHEKSS